MRPLAVGRLVSELSRLPGIGEKTATRLAHFILRQEEAFALSLAHALTQARMQTRLCPRCYDLTDAPELCSICADPRRDAALLCVVEEPPDVESIEQTRQYAGGYHVLHGRLSPLDGVGPEDLKIRPLLDRLASADPQVQEIILATNLSVEGEATAMYLVELLRPLGLKLTQLASGLPVGSALEYTDRQTLSRALTHRQVIPL